MRKFMLFSFIICAITAVFNCGPNPKKISAVNICPARGIKFFYDQNGISEICRDGERLINTNGGYYIIGSCSGADSQETNVTSQGSDGKILTSSPGGCAGSPFSLSIKEDGPNAVIVTASIGPLVTPMRGLSIPLDPMPQPITEFKFNDNGDNQGYWFGCASTWTRAYGMSGKFADIPQDCLIPDIGKKVGAVRTGRPLVIAEIRGPNNLIIRRTVLPGSYWEEWIFYHHPGTNNIEVGFLPIPPKREIISRGTEIFFQERIEVF